MPALTELLKGKDDGVRWSAIAALVRIDPTTKALVPALTTIYAESKNSRVASALGYIGAPARAAIPILVESLRENSSDSISSEAAFRSLRRFGVEVKAAMPALIEMLKDEDASNRWCAVALLGQIGPDAKAALPLLRAAVNEEDPNVRIQAALELSKIEGDKKTTLRILLGRLKDKDLASPMDFAPSPLEVLAEMGADAKEAIPALTALMKENENPRDKYNVATTLLRIDRRDKLALSVVLANLTDPQIMFLELEGALFDVPCLRDLGPEAKAATPVLLRLIQRANFYTNMRLGIDPLSGQPPLLDTLKKLDPQAAAKLRVRLSLLLDAGM